MAKLTLYEWAEFECDATTGAKLANCKKKRKYNDYLKHAYKHH